MSQELVKSTREKMQKAYDTLSHSLSTVRTGRANASLLDLVKVDYFGFPTPLAQLAQITVPEPRVIMIKPYEKDSLKEIEKAIQSANLGLNPVNDGTVVRLNIPALNEDRRKELTKTVNKYAEEAKIAIRNIRRDANEALKKDKAASEDQRKRFENEVQKVTDEFSKKIDQLSAAKDKEILTL